MEHWFPAEMLLVGLQIQNLQIDRFWHSETRRHCFGISFVKGVDVLAYGDPGQSHKLMRLPVSDES
jgi:hypothetical protein